jgi:hypothetical protein
MTDIEREILSAIEDAEAIQKSVRHKISFHRNELEKFESQLIEASITREKLILKLKKFKDSLPNQEVTLREKEIEDFRSRMDDLKKRGFL